MKWMHHTFIFLAVSIAAGCYSGPQDSAREHPAISARLNMTPSRGIRIVSGHWDETAGYLTREGRSEGRIENSPETASNNVWQAEISPRDEYLAVLSEGEGHPAVDIFEVRQIFSDEDHTERIVPVSSIDPYPGTIRITGWQGEPLLAVESDMPLDLLNKRPGRVLPESPGAETRQFLWNVSTGTIIGK